MKDQFNEGENKPLASVARVEAPVPITSILASFSRRQASMMVSLIVIAFVLGLGLGGYLGAANSVLAESTLTAHPEFQTLENTWELIHEQWPDPSELNDATLIYGAAQGMVDA